MDSLFKSAWGASNWKVKSFSPNTASLVRREVGFQRQLKAIFLGFRRVFTWHPVPGNRATPPLALSQLVFCCPKETRAYTVFFALML